MTIDTVRIDNDRNEIANLLGEEFLTNELETIPFKPKTTIEDFWKQAHRGVFLLLSASKKQPEYGASVHITVLINGTIRNASPAILKRKLVGVQRVSELPS